MAIGQIEGHPTQVWRRPCVSWDRIWTLLDEIQNQGNTVYIVGNELNCMCHIVEEGGGNSIRETWRRLAHLIRPERPRGLAQHPSQSRPFFAKLLLVWEPWAPLSTLQTLNYNRNIINQKKTKIVQTCTYYRLTGWVVVHGLGDTSWVFPESGRQIWFARQSG